jgi:glycosyltransferase involved in cell wall biosynthesis
VGDLFGASDIFLSPSRAEGWCYGVAEAMVNEVPAIAADIPPMAWARGAAGVYFCEAGDSDSLASRIRQVAALSSAERRIAGALAKRFVADRYSAACWGSNIWDLYEQVCTRSRSAPPYYPWEGEMRAPQ